MSGTVVSRDSVIDRDAKLCRALVMPHTYVGPLLEVRDAIVAGNLLIDVDSGTHTRISDSFMLSSIDNRTIAAIARDAAARVVNIIRAALSARRTLVRSEYGTTAAILRSRSAAPGDRRGRSDPEVAGASD
jgi:hypothetical protein